MCQLELARYRGAGHPDVVSDPGSRRRRGSGSAAWLLGGSERLTFRQQKLYGEPGRYTTGVRHGEVDTGGFQESLTWFVHLVRLAFHALSDLALKYKRSEERRVGKE